MNGDLYNCHKICLDEIDIGNSYSEERHNYTCENQTGTDRITQGYDGYEQNYDHKVHASYTSGKKEITIRVKYVYYAKLGNDINEYYYWIYSYKK